MFVSFRFKTIFMLNMWERIQASPRLDLSHEDTHKRETVHVQHLRQNNVDAVPFGATYEVAYRRKAISVSVSET